MTKLVKELKDFVVTQERSTVYVSLSGVEVNEKTVEGFIVEMVKRGPIDLGRLGQTIHTEFPDFDVKSYGYSQLGTFVQSIEGIIVEPNKGGKYARFAEG